MTAVADAPVVMPVRERADVHRQIKLVVAFGLSAALLVYCWLSTSNPHVLFGERGNQGGWFGNGGPAKAPTNIDITWIQVLCVVVAVAALVLAVLNKVPRSWVGALICTLAGAAFFTGFYLWNFVDQSLPLANAVTVVEPFGVGIDQATPLILGALAGCLCERAGVINIAIEGQFLLGAFLSAVSATLMTHVHGMSEQVSAAVGLLGGIGGGVLIAALLALFATTYHVNQVVLGVVLTAFATGLTGFFFGQIRLNHGWEGWLNSPPILNTWAVPGLSSIPFVGKILFDQSLLVYLMYLSIALVWFLLFQTRWGLRVRAVGEHPKAADTVGIKVLRMRWQAVLLGGLFAGLGGAYFTVGNTGAFQENMAGGKGFIALAAVIMGRWNPIGATLAALFFGMMVSLQNQFTIVDPDHAKLFGALPYVAVIVAVAGFIGRVRPPAADGEPYEKQ
ncbi:ABC transporter permease [Nocardioides montaniterrae]